MGVIMPNSLKLTEKDVRNVRGPKLIFAHRLLESQSQVLAANFTIFGACAPEAFMCVCEGIQVAEAGAGASGIDSGC